MKINRVVYRLWHDFSDKGRIGYIGKDSYWPRRSNLCYRKNRNDQPKLCSALEKYSIKLWRKEVLADGFGSNEELSQAEMLYIKKFDSKNRGYNCTEGGEGSMGVIISEETRKRIREASSGKNHRLFGKHHPIKTRRKISQAHIGMRYSEETKRKVGKASRGREVSLQTRNKISQSLKGRKFSKETRKKLSEALKGRVFTTE